MLEGHTHYILHQFNYSGGDGLVGSDWFTQLVDDQFIQKLWGHLESLRDDWAIKIARIRGWLRPLESVHL